jgi:integrase/recombinase XerD
VTNTTRTTEVAVVDLEFSDAERYALAAFLAGYRGLTRDAYTLDLRQSSSGARSTNLRPLRSAGRTSSASPRSRGSWSCSATVARRLCTVAGFYRYAEEEG